MMRMRKMKSDSLPPRSNQIGEDKVHSGDNELEIRPCGMLVQKRDDRPTIPPPTIRVRVKYASVYHEVRISSQATFGDLKKMLSGPTGLNHLDQKLFYKNKERDSKAFLDSVGVKDKSKMVLQEDPISQEKRYVEMRKNAKVEKAAKMVSEVSLEVDKLGGEVSKLESAIGESGTVSEKDVLNLTDSLMSLLVKLDDVFADGDVKSQKRLQVKRVQKYVEALDAIKTKSVAASTSNGEHKHSNGKLSSHSSSPRAQNQQRSLIDSPVKEQKQQQTSRRTASNVVITTQWETFDSVPIQASTSNNQGKTATAATTAQAHQLGNRSFTWDLL